MHLPLHLHFCLCICILKSRKYASKRHSRDKCRIQGIKTIFLYICLCICILPLYLPSEIDKSRFKAAFKKKMPHLGHKNHFPVHLPLHLHFCLCICLLKSTNHTSKGHSRYKYRIQGIKNIFLCIYLCICILPLYLPSEIDKSRFKAASKI